MSYYNYVNVLGYVKEINKDEKFLKLEIDRSTTIKISLPEELAYPVFQVPEGKMLGVKGRLVVDQSGKIGIIGERIIGFENKEGE